MPSSSSSSSMKKIFSNSNIAFVVIRIVLILILVFLVYIPKNVLAVFENFFFQAFYLLLMAYLALMDAPSGLLMATIFLFAIQQLNQSNKSSTTGSSSVALMQKVQPNQMMDKKTMGMDNSESERMMMVDVMQTLENEKLVNGVLQRKTIVEKQRDEVDMTQMFDNFGNVEHFEPTGGMDILDPSTHPAFKTMTENLAEDSKSFTSKMQFQDAGSNLIPGADPNVGIKAWKNGLSAQGLDLPNGYDKSDYYGSVF
jgi:hypothetical protein